MAKASIELNEHCYCHYYHFYRYPDRSDVCDTTYELVKISEEIPLYKKLNNLINIVKLNE